MTDKIRYFTFEKYHNRKQIGSTKLRVHNLIKYWPEAEIYKYGEKPDVMVFQKVYIQPDWDMIETLDCIKILDICDPDWLDNQAIKQTIDAVDAVTCPTQPMQEFLSQMTDKPVRVIKDRFDLSRYPTTIKEHSGTAKNLVWFGYQHNAKKLKGAMKAIIDLGLNLTVYSNKDPNILHWAESSKLDPKKYRFLLYDEDNIIKELQTHDIAILPQGFEPTDRFKSENKDIMANLCGLPVVKNREELTEMLDPEKRNIQANEKYMLARQNYDCKQSVLELKQLIEEIKNGKNLS